MKTIRQYISEIEDANMAALYVDQLMEGVALSKANTIGIEIEMAFLGNKDAESNRFSEYSELELIHLSDEERHDLIFIKNELHSASERANKLQSVIDIFDLNDPTEFATIHDKYLEATDGKGMFIQFFKQIFPEWKEDNFEKKSIYYTAIKSRIRDEIYELVTNAQELEKRLHDMKQEIEAIEAELKKRRDPSFMHLDYGKFDELFENAGWAGKNDSSIEPDGREAASPSILITDFQKIKQGFDIAKELYKYGWEINDTCGVHFHLGTDRNVGVFYVLAMLLLFEKKEAEIFKMFPMRVDNTHAKSIIPICDTVREEIAYVVDSADKGYLLKADMHNILRKFPTGQGDRYFGVNVQPAMAKHGTVELRYFDGRPIINNPSILPKLIGIFRSIVHEAQTSRFLTFVKDGNKYVISRWSNDPDQVSIEKINPNSPKVNNIKDKFMLKGKPRLSLVNKTPAKTKVKPELSKMFFNKEAIPGNSSIYPEFFPNESIKRADHVLKSWIAVMYHWENHVDLPKEMLIKVKELVENLKDATWMHSKEVHEAVKNNILKLIANIMQADATTVSNDLATVFESLRNNLEVVQRYLNRRMKNK